MLLRPLGSLLGVAAFAGVALVVVGCEETPPPNPEGGFTVNFRDTGADCSIASHDAAMGTVGPSGDPALTANGSGNADVSCTIQNASGGFSVSVQLTEVANVQVTIPSFSNENTVDNKADGSMSYASTETGGDVYISPADPKCKFWVDTDAGQFVRAGEAWFTFECASIISEMSDCAMGTSYIAVRNCEGASEEEEEE
ncbi:MAG: hypothetical protein HOW73_11270 [Polyangiaceae bacterium]|nr:hypothetical protein [Polyangiaceae bacterium]